MSYRNLCGNSVRLASSRLVSFRHQPQQQRHYKINGEEEVDQYL